ncbi:uncharacterized protein LOC105703368 isoform X2 [Orussus abietinus]|uniref:uncharacterized protein LOC105703368 isoform X2 n=1 Tax=Orussus abietinus TaxID=222816 RepID=UPI000625D64B|nr:uncharacterized protein LOC105703368 isoform X2 [Orussus abietinus]
MPWRVLIIFILIEITVGQVEEKLYSDRAMRRIQNGGAYPIYQIFGAVRKLAPCGDSTVFCHLMGRFRLPSVNPDRSDQVYSPEYSEKRAENRVARSHYGGTSFTPAYYPTFDPISVLASLAFLAFLLQSFASLFVRSRSIFPTIMSGRKKPEDNDNFIAGRALRAINNYEILNKH